MEEVKVAATAVMVATVASAEKRVGTASIAASPPRSEHRSKAIPPDFIPSAADSHDATRERRVGLAVCGV